MINDVHRLKWQWLDSPRNTVSCYPQRGAFDSCRPIADRRFVGGTRQRAGFYFSGVPPVQGGIPRWLGDPPDRPIAGRRVMLLVALPLSRQRRRRRCLSAIAADANGEQGNGLDTAAAYYFSRHLHSGAFLLSRLQMLARPDYPDLRRRIYFRTSILLCPPGSPSQACDHPANRRRNHRSLIKVVWAPKISRLLLNSQIGNQFAKWHDLTGKKMGLVMIFSISPEVHRARRSC